MNTIYYWLWNHRVLFYSVIIAHFVLTGIASFVSGEWQLFNFHEWDPPGRALYALMQFIVAGLCWTSRI
jgi:hypothetical protein